MNNFHIYIYFDKYMLLILSLMIFVFVVVFLPIMHIIDIVKRGSAYEHLLLHLRIQSDNNFFF